MPVHGGHHYGPGLGDGLRKSFSFEPLSTRNEHSDSESSCDDGPDELDRPNGGVRLTHSVSMSQIENDVPVASHTENHNEKSFSPSEFQKGSYKDDDVFCDQSLPKEDKGKGKAVEEPKLQHQGRELARFLDGPVPIDAQGIYSPKACIFVANLAQHESDRSLEAGVTCVFSNYGTVFVKIRRDGRQMPFAFCQFTCEEDAATAVAYANGTVILGRPCRVEKAKANSIFIVYKISGMPIEAREAFHFLEPFGAIRCVEPLDEDVQAEMRLPPSMVVHFKMYDCRRDIRKASKRDHRFNAMPYEPTVLSPMKRRAEEIQEEEMNQYDTDRRSAYFGNLPLDIIEEELREMGESCGQLIDIRLYNKKFSKNSQVAVAFAFMEFARPDSVDDLIKNYNGLNLREHCIRIERKQTRSFGQERDSRVSVKLPNYAQSPRPLQESDDSHCGPSRMAYDSPSAVHTVYDSPAYSQDSQDWSKGSPGYNPFPSASKPRLPLVAASSPANAFRGTNRPSMHNGRSPAPYGSLRRSGSARTSIRDGAHGTWSGPRSKYGSGTSSRDSFSSSATRFTPQKGVDGGFHGTPKPKRPSVHNVFSTPYHHRLPAHAPGTSSSMPGTLSRLTQNPDIDSDKGKKHLCETMEELEAELSASTIDENKNECVKEIKPKAENNKQDGKEASPAFPMAPPPLPFPLSPYGFPPMHPYMTSPFSPFPTPMVYGGAMPASPHFASYADLYSQYLYGANPFLHGYAQETPPRCGLGGSSHGVEGTDDATKENGKSGTDSTTNGNYDSDDSQFE